MLKGRSRVLPVIYIQDDLWLNCLGRIWKTATYPLKDDFVRIKPKTSRLSVGGIFP